MSYLIFDRASQQQTHRISWQDCFLQPRLLLPRLLRIAAHDLDLLRRDIVLIVELEVDVFDEERPDLVAEAVGIQMALWDCLLLAMNPTHKQQALLP